jgi:hypothetical protein
MQFQYRLVAFVTVLALISATVWTAGAQSPRRSTPLHTPTDTPPDTARASVDNGSPVVLDGDTLFVLRTALGPFTAAARAAAVVERINAFRLRALTPRDTIIVIDQPNSADLFSGDLAVMSVLDGDAEGSGLPTGGPVRSEAGRCLPRRRRASSIRDDAARTRHIDRPYGGRDARARAAAGADQPPLSAVLRAR